MLRPLVAMALVAGCASSVSATDAGADAASFDAADVCGPAQAALAQTLLSPSEGRVNCTVVVRLSQSTLRPIAYQPFCGRPATLTDAQARALADAAMVPYANNLAPLNPSMPDDAFVFWQAPGDFGGVVAVSARLGVTVFAASTVWAGRGDIVAPTTWRDASELHDGCGTGVTIPRARGYALGVPTSDEAATVERVVNAVRRTALPGALAQRGTVLDAVVIGYTRSAGGDGDEGAEWVVLVDAAWTE